MPPTTLSDAQLARLEVVLQELARRNNAWGIGIAKQIAGRNAGEKKRIISGAFGQMYEAMLSMQMAMQSDRTPAEIAASLTASGGKGHG